MRTCSDASRFYNWIVQIKIRRLSIMNFRWHSEEWRGFTFKSNLYKKAWRVWVLKVKLMIEIETVQCPFKVNRTKTWIVFLTIQNCLQRDKYTLKIIVYEGGRTLKRSVSQKRIKIWKDCDELWKITWNNSDKPSVAWLLYQHD